GWGESGQGFNSQRRAKGIPRLARVRGSPLIPCRQRQASRRLHVPYRAGYGLSTWARGFAATAELAQHRLAPPALGWREFSTAPPPSLQLQLLLRCPICLDQSLSHLRLPELQSLKAQAETLLLHNIRLHWSLSLFGQLMQIPIVGHYCHQSLPFPASRGQQ
ncbi:hypothetical protein EJ06DRAFT_527116, partial [Trichodelitschia bisporula]